MAAVMTVRLVDSNYNTCHESDFYDDIHNNNDNAKKEKQKNDNSRYNRPLLQMS